MNINTILIITCAIINIVEVESDCNEQFRCLSELLKDFIKTYNKFDVIVQETRQNDNRYPETIKTIEIASYYLNNFIKQIIYLFKLQLEGHFSKLDESQTKDYEYDILTLNAAKIATDSNIKKVNTPREGNRKMIKTDLKNNDIHRGIGYRNSTSDAVSVKDINDIDEYYDSESENTTDYLGIDYIELYKDTTNEPIKILNITDAYNVTTKSNKVNNETEVLSNNINEGVDENSTISIQHRCSFNGTHNDFSSSVFPWIATIFIKNGNNEQFEYYCDGVLLSDTVILTAAQCVNNNGTTVDPEDVIVVLGKRSLLVMSENEKVVKIKKIEVHIEYKKEVNDAADNDISFLILEEPVILGDLIQPACVLYEDKYEDFIEENLDLATTGWAFSGELTAIMFDKEKSKECDSEAKTENIFCANYNNDVTVCPSYGNGFFTRATDNIWYLRGLRTGDPAEKGFCYNTGVYYTDLIEHMDRIKFHLREFYMN
ncbi:vitamin K-dependent protein C-like [Battus philenor]|uniref:vitamin K-dependent protein C-like n=1 Tax=Battus philenor TaxID=42288 RepID=UPI0035CF25E3